MRVIQEDLEKVQEVCQGMMGQLVEVHLCFPFLIRLMFETDA